MRAALTLLCLSVLVVPVVEAHADLATAVPGKLARLDPAALPEAVELAFTEPLDPGYSSASLLSPERLRVEASPSTLAGDRGLRLALPDRLADGVYVLTWRALSTTDGHTTAGSFVYLVGNATVPTSLEAYAGTTVSEVEPRAETLARAGATVALFALAGSAFFALVLARPGDAPPLRRLAFTAALAAALACGAGALLLASRVGLGPLESRVGLTWGARAALALVAAGALVWRADRVAWSVAALAAAAALAVQASASHAAAGPYPLLTGFADAAHLVAGAIWVGGLPALAIALARSQARTALVLRFSAVATWALAAVVLTGSMLTLAEMGSFSNLATTPWGRALLVKLALVAVLVALGGVNKFLLVPAVERGGARSTVNLRRIAGVEIAVAAAVLLAAALLTSQAPPNAAAEDGAIFAFVDEGRYDTRFAVRFAPAKPIEPGLHFFEVEAERAGAPVGAGNLTLRFTYIDEDLGSSEVPLNMTAPGTWAGLAGDLALPGDWRVDVVLSGRPDVTDERVAFTVKVEG